MISTPDPPSAASLREALEVIASMKACRNVPTGPTRDAHLYICPYCKARDVLAAAVPGSARQEHKPGCLGSIPRNCHGTPEFTSYDCTCPPGSARPLEQEHDHALCYAGFMSFIRGVDIPETTEQARLVLVERLLKAEALVSELQAAARPPETPAILATIDGRCSCAKCEARTGNIYRMIGACMNCGAKPFLILFRAGDSTTALDCPVCGKTYGVSVQRLATSDEIPVAAGAPVSPAPPEPPQKEDGR